MRTYLFKGKKKDGTGWVQGDLATKVIQMPTKLDDEADFRRVTVCFIRNELGIDEVSPETVGQFTGVYDRNGTRVFEGDYVRWFGDPEDGVQDTLHRVIWDEERCRFAVQWLANMAIEGLYAEDRMEFEVIAQ